MRFIYSGPLDFNFEAALKNSSKFKAGDSRKYPAPAVITKKAGTNKYTIEDMEVTSAPTQITKTVCCNKRTKQKKWGQVRLGKFNALDKAEESGRKLKDTGPKKCTEIGYSTAQRHCVFK